MISNKIVLFLLIIGEVVVSQELPFTHYTPDKEINPLPSAEVQKTYQDHLGYIWMAIYSSGVIRYDGNVLQLYTQDDGLKDLGIYDIIEDQQGYLWLASNTGLVVSENPLHYYQSGKKINFISEIHGIPLLKSTLRNNRLATDSTGALWVGTSDKGVIRYQLMARGEINNEIIYTDLEAKGQNQSVRALLMRKDGSLWISLEKEILLKLNKSEKRFEIVSADSFFKAYDNNILYETSEGKLYGGFSNGMVWHLDENDAGEKSIKILYNLGNRITSIIESREKELWVGSDGNGILKVDLQKNTQKMITSQNGLLSQNIYHIMQDREDNIWISQLGGVSKLKYNYNTFEHFTARSYKGEMPVLPASVVNAIEPSPSASEIWVGTSGGLVYLTDKNKSKSIFSADGLRSNWINGLVLDQQNRLWIATSKGINGITFSEKTSLPASREVKPINLMNRSGFIASYRKNTVYSCKSMEIPIDENALTQIESIWFTGYQNIYVLIDKRWFIFNSESGLPVSFFHAVELDDQGYLWVGTRDNGLYRSKFPISAAGINSLPKEPVEFQLGRGRGTFGKKITAPIFQQIWSTGNGGLSDQVETLYWKSDKLWIGTPVGLAILPVNGTDTIDYITTKNGLPADHIGSIAYSERTNSIWIGTNGGLAEINPSHHKVIRLVNRQSGLIDNEIGYYGSLAIDRDGAIYFGTTKGLSIYRPHLDKENLLPPTPAVSEIQFKEDRSGNNEINFSYTALSFANENLVRYKTRLLGYDESWSSETRESKLRYTNLPAFLFPKEYILEVLACNNNGVWSPRPLQYSFLVQPAWWRTIWAFLIYIIIISIASFFIDRIQRRRIRRKEQEKAKLAFLEAENERKSVELEQARALQLSMLPEKVPTLPHLDIAVHLKTATEVGGDYYDFKLDENGRLNVAIGDATGHGMQAGTMVALMKGLFTGENGDINLQSFFKQSNDSIREIKLGRILMAFSLLQINGQKISVSSAGMPPVYIYRYDTGEVEEINIGGMPFGAMRNFPYSIQQKNLNKEDIILMLSDGLPELKNEKEEMFDYSRIVELLKRSSDKSASEIMDNFIEAAENWRNTKPQDDDITFLVIKKTG